MAIDGDFQPKCLRACEFPEGVVPYYNCPGPQARIIDATDVMGVAEWASPEEIERIDRPVEVRMACGNAAMRGLDPYTAKAVDSVEDGLKKL